MKKELQKKKNSSSSGALQSAGFQMETLDLLLDGTGIGLWDWHLPREASMLKPHDPRHFERVLRQRVAAPLHA